MAQLLDLFTDQDLQAFADGEIHGERLVALENHLKKKPDALFRALALTQGNAALQALQSDLYRHDPALSKIMTRLLNGRPDQRRQSRDLKKAALGSHNRSPC